MLACPGRVGSSRICVARLARCSSWGLHSPVLLGTGEKENQTLCPVFSEPFPFFFVVTVSAGDRVVGVVLGTVFAD